MHGGRQVKKRQRLKRGNVTLVSVPDVTHDRRTTDLLRNAQVAPVVVDDPYERGAKITVVRSLRHDPLAALHAARQLDDAQYMAGRHWQRNRELAEIGGVRAVDPTREAVDGGRLPEARISDAQIKAFKEMAGAMKALGMEGGALVRAFLDQGLTLKDIADKWGAQTARERGYIGYRLRECLDTLAADRHRDPAVAGFGAADRRQRHARRPGAGQNRRPADRHRCRRHHGFFLPAAATQTQTYRRPAAGGSAFDNGQRRRQADTEAAFTDTHAAAPQMTIHSDLKERGLCPTQSRPRRYSTMAATSIFT
jgi:hypothetical protein